MDLRKKFDDTKAYWNNVYFDLIMFFEQGCNRLMGICHVAQRSTI